ncbi:MBOAT family protein [Sphingomonas sp. So64.6b]|uniref:MBOAT family O-acyltransferase n=1 Tax=Sphingomonas sp. So64.6b TaxID=2997354 RepID=UPI001600751C|nr:MBOAT family protein [Sphingomonas sp. So64.6b]QNA86579.1 MBOAT family protein [Sphingomonas sp. So64.6b]
MLFPTLTFGLFFLVMFAAVWSLRSNDWRKLVLLVGSWVFYGAWDWRFVPLLIVSAVINWGAAVLIARSDDTGRSGAARRKSLLIGAVAANLLMLGFFKYFGFFAEQAGSLLALSGIKQDPALMQVILPIGISFFTFQGISYVVDVAKGRVPAARLLDILLLMSFFPHLVAGPIVRAADLVPQLQAVPKLNRGMVSMGLLLIVWGLFKKAVIASELATQFVDPVFTAPQLYGSLDLILAAYGYAVQIYCDFSAYSDMAIGLAALLGYRFPRNFDRPYRAESLQEFWRRWHISLSRWLRDYLYIDALGGNKGGRFRVYRNLMITMLLGGLWHGASWTFVIWGGLHGTALVVERLWARMPATAGIVLPRWAKIALTFHVVVLGWIFFRAASFGDALAYLGGIFAPIGTVTATPLVVLLIAGGLAIHALPWDGLTRAAQRIRTVPAPLVAAGLAVAMLVVDAMRYEGVAPFIYFRF